jgi:hypothetical protein
MINPVVQVDRAPWTDRDSCKPIGVAYGDVWYVEIAGVPLAWRYLDVVRAFSTVGWLPQDVRAFLADDRHHEQRALVADGTSATWRFFHNQA